MNNITVPGGYKVPLLVYHSVRDIPVNEPVYSIQPALLDAQTAMLSENGYTFITFEDMPQIDKIKKPVMLTFDDGYENNFTELFPILKNHHIKATVSAVCGFLGKDGYLTTAQVQKMSDSGLVSFQSHTVSHLPLTRLDSSQLQYELEESKKRIFEITQKLPTALIYPMAECSAEVVENTQKYYSFGVAANGKCWVSGRDDYKIGRLFIPRGLDAGELAEMLDDFIGTERI